MILEAFVMEEGLFETDFEMWPFAKAAVPINVWQPVTLSREGQISFIEIASFHDPQYSLIVAYGKAAV